MTIAAFQSCLAELIADRATDAFDSGMLTDFEKRRLENLASQSGVDVMRTLYFSWRLTKVLSLLPLTAALLGDDELARHLREFWKENNSTSLYFVDECLSFLAFLEGRRPQAGPYLEEVMAFERAKLNLRQDASCGRVPAARRVRFRHSPGALFRSLSTGSDLSEVPPCNVVMQGELTEDGNEHWTVVEDTTCHVPSPKSKR